MTSIPVGDDDLQAFLDRRLSSERLAVVEAYLAAHPDIAARLERTAAAEALLGEALREKFEEPIPARLRVATLSAARRQRGYGLMRQAAAVILIVGISATGGWFARDIAPSSDLPATDRLAMASTHAYAAFRTFSVEVRHPVEVSASDTPHLSQWISTRLQRPLAPPDLTALGLRLMGGRVLPTEGAPAAQLMYDNDRGARLTVFVQPMEVDSEEFHYTSQEGVQTVSWSRDRLAVAVTGRVTQAELMLVAQTVQRGIGSPAAP